MAPFCFAIPLRSKATSNDWARVEAQLAATLDSIFAQTDPDFSVLVACHDVPGIPQLRDRRVTVLTTDIQTPTTFAQMMLDKKHKRRMMAVEFGRRGGGYFMLTDSDDYVSNRIVDFVRSTNDPNGYVFKSGWLYDSKKKTLLAQSNFDILCGTCSIFNFSQDDLPRSLDDTTYRRHDDFGKHFEFERTAIALGRPLVPLPFRAAIYVLASGENTGVMEARSQPLLRKIVRSLKHLGVLLRRKIKPSSAIRKEFSLY